MLKLFVLLFSATMFGSSAFAAPLISVTKASGFVMPMFSYNLNCTINPANTIMQLRRGQRPAVISAHMTHFTSQVPNAFMASRMIALAAGGLLISSPGPTDLPTSSFYGFWGNRKVPLLINQSILIRRNNGRTVNALLQFANLNCPAPR
jgi:hypothetical protein